MTKPYLIDGVIGNSKMLATLTKDGQLRRLWWPRIDFPQHVDRMTGGIFCPGLTGSTIWLHQEEWEHRQEYMEDSNILRSQAYHPGLGLKVVAEDLAVPGQDILLRDYLLENLSGQPLPLRFLYYASFFISESNRYNAVFFHQQEEAMVYYREKIAFALGSPLPCTGYQGAWDAWEDAQDGHLSGSAINLTTSGSLAWDLGVLAPGAKVSLSLFLAAGHSPEGALGALAQARARGAQNLKQETLAYWQDYLARGKPVATGCPEVDRLYRRSLLVFRLMWDEAHGGILAAPEFDEGFTACGGYAYCWGRDAAFIAVALDLAGYRDMTEKFYRWAMVAQSPDGGWQQRHYLDGTQAPSWGQQLDETGSILWGMAQHYRLTGSQAFLQEVWPSMERGAAFLLRSLQPETGLPLPTVDLWEERTGIHTYSTAAVAAGLLGAAEMAEIIGRKELAAAWQGAAQGIIGAMEDLLWDSSLGRWLRSRNLALDPHEYAHRQAAGEAVFTTVEAKGYTRYWQDKDATIDSSLLGGTIPFGLWPAGHPKMEATAEAVATALWTPGIGGIRRYQGDPYRGGNPWILCTLWLALYHLGAGRGEQALELLRWTVEHRTELDLLPEQVDRNTGDPAWVIPLTWSHAMFVLVVLGLMQAGVFPGPPHNGEAN